MCRNSYLFSSLIISIDFVFYVLNISLSINPFITNIFAMQFAKYSDPIIGDLNDNTFAVLFHEKQ